MGEGALRIPSMRGLCSPEEWQARVDLAACYRLVDLYGMSDMMANHISVRVPGEEGFLINPYGMMYEEITASCLIKVDLAGTSCRNPTSVPSTTASTRLVTSFTARYTRRVRRSAA
jgi:ribulose-5-phosphate 4-epimerase/fuculose-1-phosphate aldolase